MFASDEASVFDGDAEFGRVRLARFTHRFGVAVRRRPEPEEERLRHHAHRQGFDFVRLGERERHGERVYRPRRVPESRLEFVDERRVDVRRWSLVVGAPDADTAHRAAGSGAFAASETERFRAAESQAFESRRALRAGAGERECPVAVLGSDGLIE